MSVQRIAEFDIWHQGYGNATIHIYLPGTTTHADVFKDEDLTVPADNPQVLISKTDGAGREFGKFAVPIYTGGAYYLKPNTNEETGVQRPGLVDGLSGENASGALVTPSGGSVAASLASHLARQIYAVDYGALGANATTNNATLTAAIGAAAGRNGVDVVLPNGTFPFTALTLSAGVVLRGQGRGATILQSQTGGEVITLTGDRAGLRNLTLDGLNKVPNSVGVFGKARAETALIDVEVKRFVTGIHFKGHERANWSDLYVSDCDTGVKGHGDINAGGGSDGGEFRHNRWSGGIVQQCAVTGVELSYEDRLCTGTRFDDVGFVDNIGEAVLINGARFTEFRGCWWSGNTGNFLVRDDTDTTDEARESNTVIGLVVDHAHIDGGTAKFKDTCQDLVFQQADIRDVDFTLQTPIFNPVVLYDCSEDWDVTIAGEGTKLLRWNRTNNGASSGLTTDATATKAWAMRLRCGQYVCLWVSVIGRRRNAAQQYTWQGVAQVYRPGASLAYDTQTANFTAGKIVTGQSSGARGRIQADSDSGSTGTLTLIDVEGTFLDNEILTDELTGQALVNGALSEPNVASALAGLTAIASSNASSFGGVTLVPNGPEIELRVGGLASADIEWTVDVDVVSN